MRTFLAIAVLSLIGCASAPVKGDIYSSSYTQAEPRDDAPELDTGSGGGFRALPPLQLSVFGQSAPPAGHEHIGQTFLARTLTTTENSGAAYGLTLDGSRLGLNGAASTTFLLGTASAMSVYIGGGEAATVTSLGIASVGTGRYVQTSANGAGAPTAADCDANPERGRFYVDTTNNRLYVCNGGTRLWDYVALTD